MVHKCFTGARYVGAGSGLIINYLIVGCPRPPLASSSLLLRFKKITLEAPAPARRCYQDGVLRSCCMFYVDTYVTTYINKHPAELSEAEPDQHRVYKWDSSPLIVIITVSQKL